MILGLAGLLLAAWVVFFLFVHVTSGFIHLLIVLAVVAVIFHFVRGRSGSGRGTRV